MESSSVEVIYGSGDAVAAARIRNALEDRGFQASLGRASEVPGCTIVVLSENALADASFLEQSRQVPGEGLLIIRLEPCRIPDRWAESKKISAFDLSDDFEDRGYRDIAQAVFQTAYSRNVAVGGVRGVQKIDSASESTESPMLGGRSSIDYKANLSVVVCFRDVLTVLPWLFIGAIAFTTMAYSLASRVEGDGGPLSISYVTLSWRWSVLFCLPAFGSMFLARMMSFIGMITAIVGVTLIHGAATYVAQMSTIVISGTRVEGNVAIAIGMGLGAAIAILLSLTLFAAAMRTLRVVRDSRKLVGKFSAFLVVYGAGGGALGMALGGPYVALVLYPVWQIAYGVGLTMLLSNWRRVNKRA